MGGYFAGSVLRAFPAAGLWVLEPQEMMLSGGAELYERREVSREEAMVTGAFVIRRAGKGHEEIVVF